MAESDAPQPPKRDAIQASRIGATNWLACEDCITRPLPVPTWRGLRACTGTPENTAAGITPAQEEKASTSRKRGGFGSTSSSMPTAHSAMMAKAAIVIGPRRTPRASSQPPARLPGTLISTISAVSSAAAASEPPRSSTTKVGSQIMTEVHCAT